MADDTTGVESADPAPTERVDAYAANPIRQWWLVVVLMLLTTLATVDRQVIALLANPIKADLGLTDVQLSLVVSSGFAVANVLFTLPAGYLADRMNRKALVAAGALVWSALTMAGGLAGSFGRLLATRAGVGFGEAVILPCSLSMLRSALSPERQGRGFAIYAMQGMLGSALAMLVGGLLAHLAASGALAALPVIGALRPWEAVLVMVGVAGIPITALILTVREPARLGESSGATEAVSYRAALRHIGRGWRAYAPIFLFQITYSMTALSFGAWLAAMLGRVWGLSMAQIGGIVGMMMLVLPVIGLFLMGNLIDWMSSRRGTLGVCLVGIGAIFIHWTTSWMTPLAPTLPIFWALLASTLFISGAPSPIAPTLLARITPDRLMGKVTAIQYFLTGIMAAAVGPTIVGVASDHLFSGPRGLAHALSLVTAVYGAASLAVLIVAARTVPGYERDHS